MVNYILNEGEHYLTIDINSNSALHKSYFYFELKDYIEGKITESQFKTGANNFVKYADMHYDPVVSMAGTIVGVINGFVPSKKATVAGYCKHAADMFNQLSYDIARSIYPKWEIRMIVKRVSTNDGSYIDIPIGRTITGYYTPTGQKLMS